MSRFICALVILGILLSPGMVYSGSVVLKNGHVINGTIIVSDEEKIIMSWGNGRTTIYHRFIESISLTEEEKLNIQEYRSAQSGSISNKVSDSIQLPEFNELHSDREETDFAELTETDSELEPVEDVSGLSEVSVHEISPVKLEFVTHEFQRFGIAIDLPTIWKVKEFKDSISIRSDCEEVLIAVDRYSGGQMTDGRAAVGLQGRLNDQGFQQAQNGLNDYMAQLGAGFAVESVSPGQTHHSVHALLEANSVEEKYLISLYRAMDHTQMTDEVLHTVMDSLEFSDPEK